MPQHTERTLPDHTRRQPLTGLIKMLSVGAMCLSSLGMSWHPRADTKPSPYQSEDYRLEVTTMVQGLDHPWSVAFLPGARADAINALITERSGTLRRIRDGVLESAPVDGVPAVAVINQGGLLDIALAPDFDARGELFLTLSEPEDGKARTALYRARYDGRRLVDVERLAGVEPASDGGRHFGSRIVFDESDAVIFSAGERGQRARAQDPFDRAGSILRITRTGETPADNPFRDGQAGDPLVLSWGHRNPQGLVRHPVTGELWEHEHAPRGGDEVNVIRAGANYGWPVIGYGREYTSPEPVGEGTERDDITPPRHVWIPSIAPSGMTFYTGEHFPAWQGDLFVGSLKFGMVVRLEINAYGDILHEERLLEAVLPRIRDVRDGPDGYLYLLTDEKNGKLLRVGPAAEE